MIKVTRSWAHESIVTFWNDKIMIQIQLYKINHKVTFATTTWTGSLWSKPHVIWKPLRRILSKRSLQLCFNHFIKLPEEEFILRVHHKKCLVCLYLGHWSLVCITIFIYSILVQSHLKSCWSDPWQPYPVSVGWCHTQCPQPSYHTGNWPCRTFWILVFHSHHWWQLLTCDDHDFWNYLDYDAWLFGVWVQLAQGPKQRTENFSWSQPPASFFHCYFLVLKFQKIF